VSGGRRPEKAEAHSILSRKNWTSLALNDYSMKPHRLAQGVPPTSNNSHRINESLTSHPYDGWGRGSGPPAPMASYAPVRRGSLIDPGCNFTDGFNVSVIGLSARIIREHGQCQQGGQCEQLLQCVGSLLISCPRQCRLGYSVFVQ